MGGERRARPADPELRGLTANAPSRVGPVKAMRARDVSRPRDGEDGVAEGDGPVRGAQGDVGGTGRSGSAPVDS
jgi:hypothetical protein